MRVMIVLVMVGLLSIGGEEHEGGEIEIGKEGGGGGMIRILKRATGVIKLGPIIDEDMGNVEIHTIRDINGEDRIHPHHRLHLRLSQYPEKEARKGSGIVCLVPMLR